VAGWRNKAQHCHLSKVHWEKTFLSQARDPITFLVHNMLKRIAITKELRDLLLPPANCLEMLHGDREGQHSIRINDQWRICFTWQDNDAYDVEVGDYH
jgi:proteic killer suppression protein